MKPLIEMIGVTKDFIQGDNIIRALKETNFTAYEGELIAIVGPSGSGKSTFLTILGGLQKPTTGRVLLNGKPFSDLDVKEKSKIRLDNIGFILQASNLIPFLTIKEQMILYNKITRTNRNQAWMDEFSNFSFIASNQAFNGIWSYNYEGISRTNTAIDYLTDDEVMSKLNMESSLKNRLLGEAYFLRAFYYFDLVNLFGDVPLLIKPLQSFEEAYEVAQRADKSTVWDQIKSDLSDAKALLPNTKFSSETEKWRVSKGAVIAMQAKTALFNEQW